MDIRPPNASVPFRDQVQTLVRRVLGDVLTAPGTLLFAFVFAAGFVIVNEGLLGSVHVLDTATGGSYLRFIIPSGVMIATLPSGIAGYLIAQDGEDRYLDRLLTMPVSRLAIVLAPMLLGGAYSIAVATTVIAFGALLGAYPVTGVLGMLSMLSIAALWGISVAGYMTAAALLTRRIDVTRIVDLCSFPLIYLSPILIPVGHLQGWLRLIAQINPTTYALGALRSLMITGWRPTAIVPALAAGGALICVTLGAATWAARRATCRR